MSLAGGTGSGVPGPGGLDLGAEPTRPGALFAERYEIRRELGRGGMGIVYEAYDTRLSEGVAVKVLMPHHAANAVVLKRFLAEVSSARKLTHPNIVKVFDLGEAAETVYFTMELLEGRDLDAILAEEGAFTVERTVQILVAACSALDAAHRARLVHRDIKLENLFLTLDDEVKVLDFGVAKVLDRGTTGATGQMIGTPAYMAPEQVSPGATVDYRADIYAMGVVAFRMLTGRLPFDASDPLECALQHVHNLPPSPRSIEPSIPPALDEVILRALAKDPERRQPSAGELGKALEATLGGDVAQGARHTRVLGATAREDGRTHVRETAPDPPGAVRSPDAPALPAPPTASWSIMSGGKIVNDLDRRTIQGWIAERRVGPLDHARVERGKWYRLEEFPDFVEDLAKAPAPEESDFHVVPPDVRTTVRRGRILRLVAWAIAIVLFLGAYGSVRVSLKGRAVEAGLRDELESLYFDDPLPQPDGTKKNQRRIASEAERRDALRSFAKRHGIGIATEEVRLIVDRTKGNLYMEVPYDVYVYHLPVPRHARVMKPIRLRNDDHLKDFLLDPGVCYVGVRRPDIIAWIAERTALGQAVPDDEPCRLDAVP